MSKQVDHLNEDPVIPGQQYVCLSFVSPEGIKNCTIRALKVRGVFSSYEDAQRKAKELQENDPDFNVFIGEVGKWLPWDPNPHEGAHDQIYYEKEMQDLVSAYKDNLASSKKEVKERAENAKKLTSSQQNKPLTDGDIRKQKQMEKLREKLRQKKESEITVDDLIDNNIDKVKELQKNL